MNTQHGLSLFKKHLPDFKNADFERFINEKSTVIEVEKGSSLIGYQTENKQLFFVAEGSFVRNIITSRGEVKTVMFHTESFNEFFKSYDSVYLHKKTDYEVVANEKSVVVALDFDEAFRIIGNDLELLRFYTHKTEELFLSTELFRNFRIGLTAEEYLLWLYENYGFLFQRFPSHKIADFMGITPVWLSKLKAKLIS